jgi:histidinol phosphatase-like enzyme
MSGREIIETRCRDKDVKSIIYIINNYENLLKDEQIKTEGKLTEKHTGSLILSTCRNNMVGMWSQFCNEIQQDLTAEQVDDLVEKLKTDISNALEVMNRLNGELSTKTLKEYYNKYDSTH